MQISTKDWNRYIDRLSAINAKAAEMMQTYIQKNGFKDTEKIIQMANALATKYGEAAASVTCDMYEAIAKTQGVAVPPAEPAQTPTMEETKNVISSALKRAPSTVPDETGKLVKKTSTRTMRKNAARDNAKMALVPSGDGCAFCMVLASRGWEPARADKSFEAHLHKNCKCEYIVRFKDNLSVEGYDPEEYKRIYDEAEGKTSQEKINSMRRAIREENKDKINAQKRAAYAKKIENEESNKRRKALEQKTLVKDGLLGSNEYRRRIDDLTGDVKESRAIAKSARQILEHRTGTFYEDLAYYNTMTGKMVINKSYDYYENGISACVPNKKMRKMIKNAQKGTVIGIHNHPKSGAPSISDIIVAKEKKYKYGIVLGHNGTIYKYSVSQEFQNVVTADFRLAKLETAVYNNAEQIKKAISDLKGIGIEIEVR